MTAFLLKYAEQLVLVVVGIFIALNPSIFSRGFSDEALRTQRLFRIAGIVLAAIFAVSILYSYITGK